MDCQCCSDNLSRYLDDELPDADRGAFEAHVAVCPECCAELACTRELDGRVAALAAATEPVTAPADLWDGIDRRLRASQTRATLYRLMRKPMALAASLALLIGAAAFIGVWLAPGTQSIAHASVDYSILLDGLAKDVDAAVDRFLRHYAATQTHPGTASDQLSLSFRVPEELPGGFQREGVYRLQFGHGPGLAARYRRDGEPLFVFFHSTLENTRLGVHQDSHCDVAARNAGQVEVGDWHLIHFTDATTCHCLLSRISDEKLLQAVLSAVSPALQAPSPAR